MRSTQRAFIAFALLAAGAAGADEPTAAQRAGMLLGKMAATCEFALPEDWRDATAEDYADPAWAAWSRLTGSATPWRAEADFDGDGRGDVAKVVIHRRDAGRWMMGVKFGLAPGEDCHADNRHPRRFQISDDNHGRHALAGVLALAQGSDHVACHQNGGTAPLLCRAPDDAAFAARPGAALLSFDAQPSYVSGYFWRAMRSGRTRLEPATPDDPDALWQFDHVPMRTEVDAQALVAQAQASAHEAKAGDRVGAAERAAVVAEFNAAWAAFERVPRSRAVQSMQAGKDAPPMRFLTTERLAPDRRRVLMGMAGAEIETIRIGAREWTRSAGGAWNEQPAAPEPPASGGIVGAEDILAVRSEQRGGRAVKVLELSQALGATTLRRTLVIDVARRLPLQIVDGEADSPQRTTIDFDYDTAVTIEAP